MYALLWRQDGSEGSAWYLRGIREDGSFYGEVRHQSADGGRNVAAGVEGRLSPGEAARLWQLVEVIRRAPPSPPGRGHFAALVERLDPTDFGRTGLRFTYRLGDEAGSEAARALLELVALVEPHLSPFYARLDAAGAGPDAAGG
jgi:hypothetical protein